MSPRAIDNELAEFGKNLDDCRFSHDEFLNCFRCNFRSDFLNRFLRHGIDSYANEISLQGLKSATRRRIVLLHGNTFEYSAWLWSNDYEPSRLVRWASEFSIVGVRGTGRVRADVYKVVGANSANEFSPDAKLELLEERWISSGEIALNSRRNEVLDIGAFEPPVVLEMAAMKSEAAELTWNFLRDSGRVSFVEMASVTNSRIRTALEISRAMKVLAPDKLLEEIFEFGDPQLKLNAVYSMLELGHDQAFVRLNECIDSENKILSDGAQQIFNQMMH